MIVVDCSALVHVFTATAIDEELLDRFAAEQLHAPDLVDVEMLNALRGLTLGRKISRDRAEHARALYADLRITRYPTGDLADRIWALRHGMTAYDAAYVVLAEVLGCPLVTRDAKLLDGGHGAKLELYTG